MTDGYFLAINGGSSSLKFALYEAKGALKPRITGQYSNIGLPDGQYELKDATNNQQVALPLKTSNHAAAVKLLISELNKRVDLHTLQAVGHRIVHGGPNLSEPARVTTELIAELEKIKPYAPEHLPSEIALIRAFSEFKAELAQVACFDTAFHAHLPRVASLLPIPRRYFAQGVRRYGFHGLSYQYLIEQLEQIAGHDAAHGRVILAHLGNGASMAAVLDGKSIDTSMAFTPTAGLVMSTRSGDIDPGLIAYLAHTEHTTPDQFDHMVHADSGLRGISETSSDMQVLLAHEQTDERAHDAVAAFCQQAKKFIGAYAADLGGLDTLVFSAGIGEHSPVIRERICRGLEFLGISIDPARNQENAAIISKDGAGVTVRVIPTDEEIEIARATIGVIGTAAPN